MNKGKGYSPGFMPPIPTLLSALSAQEEKTNKFKNYMHAFMSIISLEGIGCTLEEKSSSVQCELKTEKGWDPTVYFNLHLKMLNHVKARNLKFNNQHGHEDKTFTANFNSFVDRTIEHAQRLIEFNNAPSSTHFDKISHYLGVPNKYIIYPWVTVADSSGTPGGHQIYINLLRDDKSYTVKISDLGYGRSGELGNELKPIQLKFDHKETFDLYIHSHLNG